MILLTSKSASTVNLQQLPPQPSELQWGEMVNPITKTINTKPKKRNLPAPTITKAFEQLITQLTMLLELDLN